MCVHTHNSFEASQDLTLIEGERNWILRWELRITTGNLLDPFSISPCIAKLQFPIDIQRGVCEYVDVHWSTNKISGILSMILLNTNKL